MHPWKTIICGIDDSQASVHACSEAVKKIHEGGGMHAIAVQPPVPMTYDGNARAIEELEKGLAAQRKQFQAHLDTITEEAKSQGLTAEQTFLEQGEPHEQVIDKARQTSADVIVLGSQVEHHLQRRLIGSVATKVIGFGDVDVLLVPEKVSLAPEKGILAAVDGSPLGDKAFEHAARMAKTLNAPLHILSVADLPPGLESYHLNQLSIQVLEERAREHADKAKAKAAEDGIAAEAHIRTGVASALIAGLAKEHGAGLIVMGSHSRKGLKRLLMGSTTERVLEIAPCPVLVARS